MLEHWHEFYLLLGTAAAALVALLFVAASIGAGYLSPERTGATRTFMSPVVAHYTSVLLVSLLALMPSQSPFSLSLSTGAVALAGVAYSIFIFARVLRDPIADLPDRIAYGFSPLAGYAAILAAAWLLFSNAAAGPTVLAGATLLLLAVNIRNAWDLMLSLVRMHANKSRGKTAKK